MDLKVEMKVLQKYFQFSAWQIKTDCFFMPIEDISESLLGLESTKNILQPLFYLTGKLLDLGRVQKQLFCFARYYCLSGKKKYKK